MRCYRLISLLAILAVLLTACQFGQSAPTQPAATPPTGILVANSTPPTPIPQPVFTPTSAPGPDIAPMQPESVYPTLLLPSNFNAVVGQTIAYPLTFTPNGYSISSLTFSIDYDSSRLYLDPADSNQDGLPDAIRLGSAAGYGVQFRQEQAGGYRRLNFAISDQIAPLKPFPAGQLLTIGFRPTSVGLAAVPFSANKPLTFRDLQGQTVPGQAVPGSVYISSGYSIVYLPWITGQYPPRYTIFGRVTENGASRSGVLVRVQTGNLAWSDVNGNFMIANLAPGMYTLVASAPSYNFFPSSRVVSLPPNRTNQDFAANRIVTPSPTPTRTPVVPTGQPGVCEERIYNGGFEVNGGWVFPQSSYPANYSNVVAFSGQRSLRTGIPNSWENRSSTSSAYQEFVIPINAASATLKFHLYPQTGEFSTSTSSDRQSVRLLNQNNQVVATLVNPMLGNQRFWLFYQYNLRNFRGQALRLSFETYNDGIGSVTMMFADQVTLQICY